MYGTTRSCGQGSINVVYSGVHVLLWVCAIWVMWHFCFFCAKVCPVGSTSRLQCAHWNLISSLSTWKSSLYVSLLCLSPCVLCFMLCFPVLCCCVVHYRIEVSWLTFLWIRSCVLLCSVLGFCVCCCVMFGCVVLDFCVCCWVMFLCCKGHCTLCCLGHHCMEFDGGLPPWRLSTVTTPGFYWCCKHVTLSFIFQGILSTVTTPGSTGSNCFSKCNKPVFFHAC